MSVLEQLSPAEVTFLWCLSLMKNGRCVSVVRLGSFNVFHWDTVQARNMSQERSNASKRGDWRVLSTSPAVWVFPGAHPGVCSLSELSLSHWRQRVKERTDVMQITLELRLLWKPIKHRASLGNCPSPLGTDLVLNAGRSHFGDKYSVIWTKQEKLCFILPQGSPPEKIRSHLNFTRHVKEHSACF